MYYSNVQSISEKGVMGNSRETHSIRREAFLRVVNAANAKGKPKTTIYYANRQYTVSL